HLVDQVQVDVEHRRRIGSLGLDDVRVPDLLEEGPGRHVRASLPEGSRRDRPLAAMRLTISTKARALPSSTSAACAVPLYVRSRCCTSMRTSLSPFVPPTWYSRTRAAVPVMRSMERKTASSGLCPHAASCTSLPSRARRVTAAVASPPAPDAVLTPSSSHWPAETPWTTPSTTAATSPSCSSFLWSA